MHAENGIGELINDGFRVLQPDEGVEDEDDSAPGPPMPGSFPPEPPQGGNVHIFRGMPHFRLGFAARGAFVGGRGGRGGGAGQAQDPNL